MHRMGCVYFDLLCLLNLHVGLKFVMFSDVSISRSSQDYFGFGVVPLLLPSSASWCWSEGLCLNGDCLLGSWACGCLARSAGFCCFLGSSKGRTFKLSVSGTGGALCLGSYFRGQRAGGSSLGICDLQWFRVWIEITLCGGRMCDSAWLSWGFCTSQPTQGMDPEGAAWGVSYSGC
jgi:hypothetical protein